MAFSKLKHTLQFKGWSIDKDMCIFVVYCVNDYLGLIFWGFLFILLTALIKNTMQNKCFTTTRYKRLLTSTTAS